MILKSGKSLPLVAVKQTQQVKTNSTTFSNCTGLVLTLKKNKLYKVDCFLVVSSTSNTYDIKFDFATTGTLDYYGTYARSHVRGMSLGATNCRALDEYKCASYNAFSDELFFGLDSQNGSIRLTLLVKGGASGGNLQLRFAQYVSGATSSTVKEGSFIMAEELKEV